MLSTIRNRVQRSIAAGKPLDRIVEAKPTAEFDKVWGKGFLKPDGFVQILHCALSQQP
jgi:hypothetical protein